MVHGDCIGTGTVYEMTLYYFIHAHRVAEINDRRLAATAQMQMELCV